MQPRFSQKRKKRLHYRILWGLVGSRKWGLGRGGGDWREVQWYGVQ